ncbi:MAG TPA: DMT family transporter [Candidatus Polarisedimenticolia bacterium]|nr:DMT family transporter [Candidatus Polarisedimenticolia bacterium]
MIAETSSGRAPGGIVLGASIALVIVIWAVNFIAAKIGLRSLPAATLASFRVVLAGAVMLPFYMFCSRLPAFAEAAECRRRKLTLGDLWTFLYMGFFGVVMNQVCFTVGLRYTSVSHAAVIVGMGPIYTLILAVLLQLEKATWRKAIGMAIAFAGIAVLASENGISARSPSVLGDAITMTGSVGFAMYAVLGKRLGTRYDPLTMTAFSHYAGAVIVLPVAICRALLLGSAEQWRAIAWTGWAAMFYMAVFSSAVAYVFYFWVLRYMEASQLSAFTYLLPVVATILGIVWLGERGSWGQVLGGVLALSGVYWIESGRGSVVRAVAAP